MVSSQPTKHLLLSNQELTCTIRTTQTTGPLQFSLDHQNVCNNGGSTNLAEPQIIRFDSYNSVFVRDYFKLKLIQVFLKAPSDNREIS